MEKKKKKCPTKGRDSSGSLEAEENFVAETTPGEYFKYFIIVSRDTDNDEKILLFG